MLEKLIEVIAGSKFEKDIKKRIKVLHQINNQELWAMSLKDEEFTLQTEKFKELVQSNQKTLDEVLPQAFALVREASRRISGERIYDTQMLGAISLHYGNIMEMKTGEGKTLSGVPAAYLNCLTGRGVIIVTVNDYLASRDEAWMKPLYKLLGITSGVITSNMDGNRKKHAYNCDITYGTNNEIGFDYLRDNLRNKKEDKVQRFEYYYCIVDEIDSILIDEARTPLIISGPVEDDVKLYQMANKVVPFLNECEKDPKTNDYPLLEEGKEPKGDYKIDEKSKRIIFTEEGIQNLEKTLVNLNIIKGSIYDAVNFEFIHYCNQSMRANLLYQKDVEYVVQNGKLEIVDEFTGRVLKGRRYSEGLHQALEAKEGIKIENRSRTLASITLQNFFRMFEKISGMTGTAETEAREFSKIYSLDVIVIPTNRPVMRLDLEDVIYFNEEDKFNEIVKEIEKSQQKGQPVLVGTASIEKSEFLSNLLIKHKIKHEVLNAKNHLREASIVAQAGIDGAVTISTNMAGRGTDIKLGGNLSHRIQKRISDKLTEEEKERIIKEETELWSVDNKRIKELGGLYVLGTERHESRRIDNQLRGRSGRQGDNGKSRFYVSLDDSLMRLFGGDRMKKFLMSMDKKSEITTIEHPMISRSIEKAQTKVEDKNFEIRKHLLEYDDVLNQQRKFIYAQRENILADEAIIDRIFNTAKETIKYIINENIKSKFVELQPANRVLEAIKKELFYAPIINPNEYLQKNCQEFVDALEADLKTDLDQKEELIGKEDLNDNLRMEYLRTIDYYWQNHLEDLDALREAVYLRSYGQKNPLTEYKIEGAQIFDSLIEKIRMKITRKILSISIESIRAIKEMEEQRVKMMQTNMSAKHNSFDEGKGNSSPSTNNSTVIRKEPKVGRNDPCPCGSGKKYKDCHGGS